MALGATFIIGFALSAPFSQPLYFEAAKEFKSMDQCIAYMNERGVDNLNDLIIKARRNRQTLTAYPRGCRPGSAAQLNPTYSRQQVRTILDMGKDLF